MIASLNEGQAPVVPVTSGLALRPESGPTESAALERQGADSLSCRGKDGIAERGHQIDAPVDQRTARET